ncbi:GNAT family protein [Lysinibacillus endophyticus]|uniref:GNAT family N-acetyltransferase n=1 Tax=Ureibacillus endophyticus TaxID=1978490 RepID=UPI0020A18B43|nr:GNAT family protein [Lysinibacillus endophyticus]MCP1144419.1 GNAT family N-acetyltransferase [Lysinibacillus endophyticus]
MVTDIYTERLHLRKMHINDSPSLFKIWSDPDVTKFMNIDNFQDESQAKEIISYLNELAEDEKAIRYSIIELTSGDIIGSCGFNSLDFDNEKAEIGYELAKSHWGKGYAPEAIDGLLDYAFNTLKLNRIEAKVEPENINSIKVLEKLHFIYEGTLRQSEKSKGRFIDLNMYSLLRTEKRL